MTAILIDALVLAIFAKFFFQLAKMEQRNSWLWAGNSLAVGCLVRVIGGFGLGTFFASQILLFVVMWAMNLRRNDEPADY